MTTSNNQLAVDARILLALYLVVPISLLFVLYDMFILDGFIGKHYLPKLPDNWAYWGVFFGLPHIVGSFITIVDKEYIRHYNLKLIIPLIVIIATAYVVPKIFGPLVLLVIIGCWTSYHVLQQQFGIALGLLRKSPCIYTLIWRWFSIIAITSVWGEIVAHFILDRFFIFGIPLAEISKYGGLLSLTIATFAAFKINSLVHQKGKPAPVALWFFWGNVVMMLVVYFCTFTKYTVFGVLIPRVLHDITAFIVYGVHDQNRNKNEYKNIIFRLFSVTRIPPMILGPILCVAISYVYSDWTHGNPMSYAVLYYTYGFYHYYVEGFLWKRDSLLRQQVRFAVA